MSTREVFVVVVAVVLMVFAWRIREVRLPPKRGEEKSRWKVLGAMWVAVPTAVVVWVLTRHLSHWLPGHAHGDHRWAFHGDLRLWLMVFTTVGLGIAAWALVKSKDSQDD